MYSVILLWLITKGYTDHHFGAAIEFFCFALVNCVVGGLALVKKISNPTDTYDRCEFVQVGSVNSNNGFPGDNGRVKQVLECYKRRLPDFLFESGVLGGQRSMSK
jgi:hypothetical protein